MTQIDLLLSGVFVFVMALIGVLFTVYEFYRSKRKVVDPQSLAIERQRSVSRPPRERDSPTPVGAHARDIRRKS